MKTAETDQQSKIYNLKYEMKSRNTFDGDVNSEDEEKLINPTVLKETNIVINTIFNIRNIGKLVMNQFIPPYSLYIVQKNDFN